MTQDIGYHEARNWCCAAADCNHRAVAAIDTSFWWHAPVPCEVCGAEMFMDLDDPYPPCEELERGGGHDPYWQCPARTGETLYDLRQR